MNNYKIIGCHHFVVDNGYAYFSNWSYNGLFRVELKTGKALFLGSFKNEKQNEFNIHLEILQQNEKIYFFPYRGRHVHVYSLTDQSISAIEIKKVSEGFFRIGEVIINKEVITFLPKEKTAPIKSLDLNTQIVTKIKNTKKTFKGTFLSQSRAPFPMPQLLEAYQIERTSGFSWKQVPDGSWCAFLLMGQHLLWYKPETKKITMMPLTVVNATELEAHLQPLRQKYLCQEWLAENNPLSFHEYLQLIQQLYGIANRNKSNNWFSTGESIWKHVKI